MDRSPGFGSTQRNYVALFRLAFATASPLKGLTLLRLVTHRLILQKARGHIILTARRPDNTPTACRLTVSGTISLSIQEFFSPFPHGTSSLSVARKYLALGDGPP